MGELNAMFGDVRGLVVLLLVGLVAGWLAGLIFRGRGFGFAVNLVLGLIGGLVGGWLFRVAGISVHGLVGQVIAATAGAGLLVFLASRLR